MRITKKKNSKFASLIEKHIKQNLKEYFIVSILLIIGIIIGVIFINNIEDAQKLEIQTYLNEFISAIKNGAKIDTFSLMKKTIGSNILVAIIMWFVGSTVIGIPIVLGMVVYRGFCLGYSIASAIAVWGTFDGTMFFITTMLLQNLIFIPCIIGLAVSGIKVYQSITNNRRKENIKLEILRHTLFSVIMLILLLVSAILESYVSSNLLMLYVPYIK